MAACGREHRHFHLSWWRNCGDAAASSGSHAHTSPKILCRGGVRLKNSSRAVRRALFHLFEGFFEGFWCCENPVSRVKKVSVNLYILHRSSATTSLDVNPGPVAETGQGQRADSGPLEECSLSSPAAGIGRPWSAYPPPWRQKVRVRIAPFSAARGSPRPGEPCAPPLEAPGLARLQRRVWVYVGKRSSRTELAGAALMDAEMPGALAAGMRV